MGEQTERRVSLLPPSLVRVRRGGGGGVGTMKIGYSAREAVKQKSHREEMGFSE